MLKLMRVKNIIHEWEFIDACKILKLVSINVTDGARTIRPGTRICLADNVYCDTFENIEDLAQQWEMMFER